MFGHVWREAAIRVHAASTRTFTNPPLARPIEVSFSPRGAGTRRGRRRSQVGRDDSSRPGREAPVAVGLRRDLASARNMTQDCVAIRIRRLDRDVRGAAAGEGAASARPIVVGDDQEALIRIDWRAIEGEVTDAARVRRDKSCPTRRNAPAA